MTKTLSVTLDKRAMLVAHLELSHLELAGEGLPIEIREELARSTAALELVIRKFELMERATLIQETDRAITYEHPEHGDEVELMLYDKSYGRLHEKGSGIREIDSEEMLRDMCDDLMWAA